MNFREDQTPTSKDIFDRFDEFLTDEEKDKKKSTTITTTDNHLQKNIQPITNNDLTNEEKDKKKSTTITTTDNHLQKNIQPITNNDLTNEEKDKKKSTVTTIENHLPRQKNIQPITNNYGSSVTARVSKKTMPSAATTTSSTVKTLQNSEIELFAGLEKLRNCLREWLDGYTIKTRSKQQQQQQDNEQSQSKTTDINSAPKPSNNSDTGDSGLAFKSYSPSSRNDDRKREDFNSKVFSFLSKNPDWSNEATMSEDFQQKMKLKNTEQVLEIKYRTGT